MARRYIDELMDGIRFSSSGPVSISLETAKRLAFLYQYASALASDPNSVTPPFEMRAALADLNREIPEPKP